MHYGSLKDLLTKKKENIDFEMRVKLAIDAARGL